MRFIKRIPLENKEKTLQLSASGWRRLKEPQNVSTAILYSIPIAFLLMVMNGGWMYFISPEFRSMMAIDELKIKIVINAAALLYVVIIFVFLFIHEMVHAVFIPNILQSSCTYWGFNGLTGFVYTEEMIGKRRYFIISVMPLLILSFLLPAILSVLGMLNRFIMLLCIINAGGSCVDILNMILVWIQVPAEGKMISNGFATYYTE